MFTKAEFVAVSDIHLERPTDVRGQVLIEVIDACAAARVECFALIGDIFDFCLGNTRYFQKKFAPISQRLEALAAGGTRVIFIEGNHEFNMAGMGWRGVEVISESNANPGKIWQSKSGKKILMTHGDLFQAPRAYLAFRRAIKSRVFLSAISAVPGAALDAYALRHAKVSRSRDPYRTLDDAAILGDARKFAVAQNADHLLFGHFHMPWAVPIDIGVAAGNRNNLENPVNPGNQALILCMDSWDKPNVLVFDGQEFHRGFTSGPKQPFGFVIAGQTNLHSLA